VGAKRKKDMEQAGFIIIGVLSVILAIILVGVYIVRSPSNLYTKLQQVDTQPGDNFDAQYKRLNKHKT
jgi:uncharacterized membrane protein (DUF485 family)